MPRTNEMKVLISADESINPPTSEWKNGIAYLPGDKSSASFWCPCGCGRYTHIPLDGFAGKQWRMVSLDPLTITPSILDKECGAHFFITNGRVDFCGDTPAQPRVVAAAADMVEGGGK